MTGGMIVAVVALLTAPHASGLSISLPPLRGEMLASADGLRAWNEYVLVLDTVGTACEIERVPVEDGLSSNQILGQKWSEIKPAVLHVAVVFGVGCHCWRVSACSEPSPIQSRTLTREFPITEARVS